MTTESQDNNKRAFRVAQSTSAPLSADSLREAVHMKMLSKSDSAKDLGELTVIPLGFAVSIAVELITGERQRIADSLPEKRKLKPIHYYPDVQANLEIEAFNEAIEAVRVLLIPPKPGDLEDPVESAS
jgi:hypothetical protein